jgi:hypothetical protein
MSRLALSLCLLVTMLAGSVQMLAQSALQRQVYQLHDQGRSFARQPLFHTAFAKSETDLGLYGIDAAIIADARILFPDTEARQALRDNPKQLISLDLPVEDGQTVRLELYRKSPLTAEFEALNSQGEALALDEGDAFYRGVVQGQEGSIASLSLVGDEIRASFSYGGYTYTLGKVAGAGDGAHVLYRNDRLDMPEGFSCQLIDEHPDMPAKLPSSTTLLAAPKTLKCVRVRVEIDNGLVTSLGGQLAAVNYSMGLFNEVSTLFANDDIDVVVSEIFAWVGSSPYSGDVGNRLSQMSNNSPNADLTALLTNVGGGGIAYLSSVCSSSFGVSVSSIFGFYNNIPGYSWDVNVCAHELGHNLSSPHTHACAWNGNNTALDGCGPIAGYSEGNCSTAALPSGGGTVMSYCHLLSTGVNFNNGFGAQPRTRIINYVNSRACLGATCVPYSGEPCEDEALNLEIVLDNYPAETSWELRNEANEVVASGGNYGGFSSGTAIDESICVPEACYTFEIFDSYGDGICCGFGNGSYTLTDVEGNVLASGGNFGSSQATDFCLGEPPVGPVPCESPYPQVQGLEVIVQPNGILVVWEPIAGSLGCQIQGGLSSSTSLTLVQVVQPELSSFFINPNQLPVNGQYKLRVRCGCSLNPPVAGPWTSYSIFNWNSAGSLPEGSNAVNFAAEPLQVQAYPNPSSGNVSVMLHYNAEAELNVRLTDLMGKEVFAERLQTMPGENTFQFDFSRLAGAVYLLQVDNGEGEKAHTKVVLKK